MNDRIRAREVRLVGPDGNQLGIKTLTEAIDIARGMDLDLVEVAPLANPPVCRILDYGKFKFDEAQRAKESRRKSTNVAIKEMKYRPKIGQGDFDTKTRQVLKFLAEGHKVKVTIMFKGREIYYPELGQQIVERIAEQVQNVAKIESEARLDGRNMVMVLAPDKRALQSVASKSSSHKPSHTTKAREDSSGKEDISSQAGEVNANISSSEVPTTEEVPVVEGKVMALSDGDGM